ncbi:MAG: motB [Paenibacillus sp.]|nr:motB [Paenibacillus sp.]
MSKRRKQHHEEHMDETWLIPYADLLTLLLALFIILFASSEVDSKKYDNIMRSLNSAFSGGTNLFQQTSVVPITTDPTDQINKKTEEFKNPSQTSQESKELLAQMEKEMVDLQELKQKLDKYIQDNGLNTQLETRLTNDLLMITIRDNALYASGSAEVKPEARKLAQNIASMLTQYPGYQVEVAGHTDDIPINTREFETNWDLSSKRALNFMKILLPADSAGAARFSAIGKGEHHPIDTNQTADGRAKNRRVEVSILRNMKSGSTIPASNP